MVAVVVAVVAVVAVFAVLVAAGAVAGTKYFLVVAFCYVVIFVLLTRLTVSS